MLALGIASAGEVGPAGCCLKPTLNHVPITCMTMSTTLVVPGMMAAGMLWCLKASDACRVPIAHMHRDLAFGVTGQPV